MNYLKLKIVGLLFIFLTPISLSYADYNLSNLPLFIPNSKSACISIKDHRLSLILKGARFEKDSSFFKEDKKLGISISANPEKIDDPANPLSYSFPVLREVALENAKKGFIQYGGAQNTIINNFQLLTNNGYFSSYYWAERISFTRSAFA